MLQTNTEKIDGFVRVITPENVEFEYALAGPFQRLPAFLFDLFLRALVLFVLGVIMMFTFPFLPLGGMLGTVVIILSYFALSWFYGLYFETRFNGRTPGKMLFKLRVISVDGRPINGLQAALRNMLRLADISPSPLSGLIAMTLTRRAQRIGDLAANTMVIADRGRHSPWDIQPDDPRAFGLAELIPPTFVANHSLAQTIGMYMENRRRLPVPRRLDVSKHLAIPLIRKFEMLPDTSPDLLLCALYVRIFMSEEQQQKGLAQLRSGAAMRSGEAPQPNSMANSTARPLAPRPLAPRPLAPRPLAPGAGYPQQAAASPQPITASALPVPGRLHQPTQPNSSQLSSSELAVNSSAVNPSASNGSTPPPAASPPSLDLFDSVPGVAQVQPYVSNTQAGVAQPKPPAQSGENT